MNSAFLSVIAVVLGVTLLQGANGVLTALLPLRMVADGMGAISVGIMATGYSVGFLAGCLMAPTLVRAVGHIRAYAIAAAALSVMVLSFAIAVDAALWTALRSVTGVCMAVLYTVADSWITDRAPQEQRGRVLSLYLVATKVALIAGPLLLAVAPVAGPAPMMVMAALISLSLIPVASTRSSSPTLPDARPMGLLTLFRIAPAAVTGAFAAGLTNTATINIVPAWGAQIGLSTVYSAGLLAAIQVGSLLGQWPLGWLSDRTDRRRVIVYATLAAALACLATAALPLVWPGAPGWMAWILLGLWAAGSMSVYSICIAHAGDRCQPEQIVPATSALLLSWAVGSAAGPTLASLTMQALGPSGLFVYSGAVAILVAVFTQWRLHRRAAPPPEDRNSFVAMPAASPVVSGLNPSGQPSDKKS